MFQFPLLLQVVPGFFPLFLLALIFFACVSHVIFSFPRVPVLLQNDNHLNLILLRTRFLFKALVNLGDQILDLLPLGNRLAERHLK